MTAHTETDLQPSSMTTHEPRAETKEACDFTGQGTILLVEDEQSLRSLIARGLRSRGYSVIEASNGVEALEVLEQSNVDLVVSDVVMPEMDGPTLLKTARVRYPNLKIIFISGYAEDVLEKSLPENQPLLPKPFRLGQLVTAVKEAISLSEITPSADMQLTRRI